MTENRTVDELRAELDALRISRASAVDELEKKIAECVELDARTRTLTRELRESRDRSLVLERELESATVTINMLYDVSQGALHALEEHCRREEDIREIIDHGREQEHGELVVELDPEAAIAPTEPPDAIELHTIEEVDEEARARERDEEGSR